MVFSKTIRPWNFLCIVKTKAEPLCIGGESLLRLLDFFHFVAVNHSFPESSRVMNCHTCSWDFHFSEEDSMTITELPHQVLSNSKIFAQNLLDSISPEYYFWRLLGVTENENAIKKISFSEKDGIRRYTRWRRSTPFQKKPSRSVFRSGRTARLQKAFQIKSVPDELKAEILLNILGERVNNLLTYVSQEYLSNYVKIKELILREFEPTPQECLSNFKKARKLPSENYVQFASRLSATFDYYCQLRKVNEFRSLCDLIISDKIFETLDRDTMNHIATKQEETYFKPQQLGRECDVYLSARGKVSNDLMSKNPGSGVKTDERNRLQKVSTWRQERNSLNVFVAETKPNCVLCKVNNFHPLSKCYQFKKLSVEDRVEVVKRNNLCFRYFLPHRLKECRSEKNCFCLRPHNSLIHFSRDKTRNPTPTSNLNLDAPTFVPGQIEGSVEANSQSQFVATGFEKGRLKDAFLSTVRTLIKNKYSQWVEVRCLLDVGSQSCLCTRVCAEKLQLKMEKINTVFSCVNDASMVVKNCVKISVANKAKTFETELMLLVVNKITDLIPNKVIDIDVNVSEFVPLADDKFNIPDRIDMLLGAEIFHELLKPGKFYCDNSHLVLQNTVFGYVVSGSVDHKLQRIAFIAD
ncbi:integrase catalytic domain-containing protein [Trichonephila clavipes]|nr:integrase catalytic domain-containing protein [Trichonephila clavipes]